MALKKNIFTEDLALFQKTLADYAHYQLFVRWQLEQASKSVERSMAVLETEGHDKNAYFTGNCQSLFNVFHDGNLEIREPYGKRVTQGQDLFAMSREMEGRHNAFVLVALYEALERYLKATFRKLLFQIRNDMPIKDKKEFHRKKPEAVKVEGQPAYFQLYVDYACARDATKALDAFDKFLATDRFVRRSVAWPQMTWREYVGAFAVCRHLIVHNYGRVSETSLRKLGTTQKVFAESCIRESLHGKEQVILPSAKSLDLVFEIIGSYGWGLYVLLSDRCAMADESEFFRPKGGGKRKVQPK